MPEENLPKLLKPSKLDKPEPPEPISSRLQRYGVPIKFIREDLSLPKAIEPYLGLQRGLCLTGKAGVGKTMALALLVRETADKNWKFISFPEFIIKLQSAYKDSYENPGYMLEKIAAVNNLVIDDLGAEKPTEYVRQASYYIINHREMHMLPTFITTNFSLDHINDHLDSRIASRIVGMCDVIRLEGPDRRFLKTSLPIDRQIAI